jgi:hypothetical protein
MDFAADESSLGLEAMELSGPRWQTARLSRRIDAFHTKPIPVLHSICLGVEPQPPAQGEAKNFRVDVGHVICYCLSIDVVAFICTYSRIVRGEPILVAHPLGGKEMRWDEMIEYI